MAETTERPIASYADELFDKYLLPKIALVIILSASLVGTAISIRLMGQWVGVVTVLKWGYFVALGVMSGGLLWKHGFVRPRDLEAGADEYVRAMYERFDRISLGGLLILVPCAGFVLSRYAAILENTRLVGTLAVAIVTLAIVSVVTVRRQQPVDKEFRHPLGIIGLGAALLAVGLTGVSEVGLRSGNVAATGIRVLHLLAFALWLGGAVWNIFVAVPTGQDRPTGAVIRAAGQQLERFRWTVRGIIPVLVVTGLYQAVDVFGTRVGAYFGSAVGFAILGKLGFIAVLVVIFKTCPMWRACSPIDGVCDLEELTSDSGSDSPGGSNA